MSRTITVPLLALAGFIAVAGCGRADKPDTQSASAGASTPVVSAVSGTTADSAGEVAVEAKPVTYERAESTLRSGNYSEATQLFSLYTESNPENAWGHYMLGVAAWKSGDHDRALSAFDRSLELDANHRKSLFNSGRVLLEMGRAQEALERIEKALAQEPMSNEGLRLLGRARYQLGQVDEAIDAYRRALVADQSDVWSMNNLGLIYIEQDRSQEALAPLARAVALKSNAPVFQNNLGVALERSGYPAAAAEAYEAAIAVDSTYKKAAVGLARVTGGGQQPESEPVDLSTLAQQFQREIEDWRESVPMSSDSTVPVSDSTISVKDSTGQIIDSTIPSPDAE
jgi:tetratricopeptide (TPR) repeat protein